MAEWTFAPSGVGEHHGFHNPGVETFKGNLERYLAREAIQNSLDALYDPRGPVRVEFNVITLDAREIPGLSDLAITLRQCGKFWGKDKKAKAFFDRAYQLATEKTVTCLRISDANTTGVKGTDTDGEQGWYNLVRSSGASAKGGGEGGSFGLGKHAPFAASRLRTVFYSTKTAGDAVAFQGVARLVTHDGGDGPKQPTGFFGGKDGQSVRTKKDIPKFFRHDEQGTDVFALGYQADEDWQEQFLYSVLEYFWPAIHRGLLNVAVGKTTVSKQTMPALMEQYSRNDKKFNAHLYYQAYTDPAANETNADLPSLGKVVVRLLTGDANLPNRVAMFRSTGMVVYHRLTRTNVPFCGVFECNNKAGNARLRDMEPPRHDEWLADLPEKGDNRQAKKELDALIIKCVKALTPVSTEKTIVIPELNQYLPDDGDTPEDSFDGQPADGAGRVESFDRTPKLEPILGRQIGRKPHTKPGGASAEEGDEEGGGGPGDTGGPPNEGTGGDKGSEGGSGDESSTAGGDQGRTPVAVRSRAFLTDAAQGLYALVIHPPKPRPKGEVFLSVAAVGDDALPTPVRVAAARLPNKHKLGVPQFGRVGPVAFPRTGPLRVEIELAQPRRLALDVAAYEVQADEAE